MLALRKCFKNKSQKGKHVSLFFFVCFFVVGCFFFLLVMKPENCESKATECTRRVYQQYFMAYMAPNSAVPDEY